MWHACKVFCVTEVTDAELNGSNLSESRKERRTFRFQTGMGADLTGGFKLNNTLRNWLEATVWYPDRRTRRVDV